MTGRLPVDKLTVHIEHFRARVLQDALLEATANYWLRRAKTFEAVGNPRCDEIALACRRHATLGLGADDHALIWELLVEAGHAIPMCPDACGGTCPGMRGCAGVECRPSNAEVA